MAAGFVRSSGLVPASFPVLSLEALQMDPCLLKRSGRSRNGSVKNERLDGLVRHCEDSTMTYLLTADCATYVGITGSVMEETVSLVAPPASWSICVTFEATQDTKQDIVLESVAASDVLLDKLTTVS